jgi:hypothetical protein
LVNGAQAATAAALGAAEVGGAVVGALDADGGTVLGDSEGAGAAESDGAGDEMDGAGEVGEGAGPEDGEEEPGADGSEADADSEGWCLWFQGQPKPDELW